MSKPLSNSEIQRMARSALGPAMMGYQQVAEYLGLSARTCKRWVAEGVLPSPDLRLRGIVRWRPGTIDRWIKKNNGRHT